MEYYLSDVNLATTDHLMRFINKDPEGFGKIGLLVFVVLYCSYRYADWLDLNSFTTRVIRGSLLVYLHLMKYVLKK